MAARVEIRGPGDGRRKDEASDSPAGLLRGRRDAEGFDRNRDPFDDPFDDDGPTDHALEATDDHPPGTDFGQRTNEHHAIARHDRITESHILETAESDHRRPEHVVPLGEITAHLSGALRA